MPEYQPGPPPPPEDTDLPPPSPTEPGTLVYGVPGTRPGAPLLVPPGETAPAAVFPYGYPVAPPRPSRRPPILITAVALALVLATAVMCGLGLATRPANDSGTVAAPRAPATRTVFAAPHRIGDLVHSTNGRGAALAEAARRSLPSTFAAGYDDPADPGRSVGIIGATGQSAQPARALDSYLRNVGSDLEGGGITDRRDVSITAPAGGVAACGSGKLKAPADPGVDVAVCGWATDDAVVGVLMYHRTVDEAVATLRAVLPAVVKRT